MPAKEVNEARMTGILPSQGADPIPVGKIPDAGTQFAHSDNADNETKEIYENTSGKTSYLTACTMNTINSSGAEAVAGFFVTNATDDLQYYLFRPRLPDGGHVSDALPFPTPLEIAEGWKIQLTTDGDGCRIYASVFGYEV